MTDEELDALVDRMLMPGEVEDDVCILGADAIRTLRVQLADVQARADRAEAERAAQIERDAGIALKHRNNLNALTSLPPQSAAAWNIYNEIRAQAHDRTALDRMLAEVREKALREAIEAYPKGVEAILAMIEKPDAT